MVLASSHVHDQMAREAREEMKYKKREGLDFLKRAAKGMRNLGEAIDPDAVGRAERAWEVGFASRLSRMTAQCVRSFQYGKSLVYDPWYVLATEKYDLVTDGRPVT